ncbi:uncharacterized protein LOC106760758 [Vigna radiata var. radiata]|uniref:Uncharacterized protein LOC106760758 n=1 Tax=Vigna radiata var. radiata TaxID=3916 RepID=A0A1S3U0W1_VIGRR|nr:uncharacterized protein LOC106760758 [Vigna radiata var. radiata]
MVGVFRRSLSFPNKNPNRPSQKPHISHHIRSISLPCRSHPLISEIRDEINGLRSWASTSKAQQQSCTTLSQGLTLLKDTHETLQHILNLPQTLESLRSHPLWLHNLLEDFLRFVDAFGIFQTSVMALKEEHSSAQMAIRKRDDSKVVAYVKARNKISREIEKIVSVLRCVSLAQHQQHCTQQAPTSLVDAELRHVIADVMSVTVSVSVALFNGMAASFAPRRLSWAQMVKLSRKGGRVKKDHEELRERDVVEMESLRNLKKKGDEEVRLVLKKMRDLDECISAIENDTEKVLRALINSRVALLNLLTLTQ